MPADARAVVPAIDDEVVAFRLQADGAVDRRGQQIVVGGSPQRLAQIGGILVAEAGVQRAGAGDADPVACFAEVVGHRRDEAELAAGLGDADIAGRAAGVVGEVGQRELLGEPRAQQRQRHILVDAAFADVAHRHHLDQRQCHALAVRPLHQRGDFFLVQILQRHRVDLDGEARRACRLDAGQHLVEIAPAGDRLEFRGVQRIQRDVDAAHAAVAQLAGKARQLRAVGGQRQFTERAAVEVARQRAHQRHHVAPDQRLAAGEPQFFHALGDEGRAQPVEFFQREQIGLGQECHVFRHAIEAAQVAAIGDRYPQIADGPAERIGHRRRRASGFAGNSVPSIQMCLFAWQAATRYDGATTAI